MTLVQQIKNGKIEEGYDKSIKSSKMKCHILEQALTARNMDIEWINKTSQPYNLKMNLFDNEIQINVYLSCVTYLGKPHPIYKKRMQLSNNADRKYLMIDNTKNNITLMIGLYLYDEKNPIFVAWDANANKMAGRSKSSHVFVNDIALAIENGISQRKDKNNNNVYCFKPEFLLDFIKYNVLYLEHEISFVEYIKQSGVKINEYMFLNKIVEFLKKDLKNRDWIWDGKKCLKEMKENEYRNWKQTEWQGFFLEYLIQKDVENKNQKLEEILEIPGPKYGRTVFDGFYNIPWDFKVHVEDSNQVITNDMEAIEKALKDYGKVGFIIVSGNAEKEKETEFSDWRNELKGELSRNQIENRKNNKRHRKLKSSFTPTKIQAIIVDNKSLSKHNRLNGVRNPNGNIRREKLILNLDKVTPQEIVLSELLSD